MPCLTGISDTEDGPSDSDSSDKESTDYTTNDRCIFCGKNVGPKTGKRHKLHILRHVGERPYICPTRGCSYEGRRTKKLRDHLRHIHGYSVRKADRIVRKIDKWD